MKIRRIVLLLFLLGITKTNAQNNFLNSRFAVISSEYKIDCIKCKTISKELYVRFKNVDVFDYYDEFPNWEAAWNHDLETYNHIQRIDFYLTSKVKRSAAGFEVVFTLWDTQKKRYPNENFRKTISADRFYVDLEEVVTSIREEVQDFKLKGKFKKVILVDNFKIIPQANDLISFSEGFSNWLAGELRDHEIISLNYRVFYYKNFNADVSNTLGGEFYPQDDKEFEMKMKMEIILNNDRPRRSKTLTIDMMEYENNIKDILDAINTIIKKYERRT